MAACTQRVVKEEGENQQRIVESRDDFVRRIAYCGLDGDAPGTTWDICDPTVEVHDAHSSAEGPALYGDIY